MLRYHVIFALVAALALGNIVLTLEGIRSRDQGRARLQQALDATASWKQAAANWERASNRFEQTARDALETAAMLERSSGELRQAFNKTLAVTKRWERLCGSQKGPNYAR